MKKWATLLAGSACALSLFSGSAAADDKELVFMNWGPYINSNILEQFTKETGIKVILLDLRVERNFVRKS